MPNIVIRMDPWEKRMIEGKEETYIAERAKEKLKEFWPDNFFGLVCAYTFKRDGEQVKADLFTKKNCQSVCFIPVGSPSWANEVAAEVLPI